jgi:peroxiredoxin
MTTKEGVPMSDKKTIVIGGTAPDFLLKDQHGQEVRLSDLKGKKVLLSWHPLAWTKVCAEQMKSVDKHYDEFERLGVMPFGLSVDTVPSKDAWAKELGLAKLRLLSDFWPHGAAADALGVFRKHNGFSQRANIILDGSQKVVFIKIYDIPQLPDIEEILAFLRT